MASNSTFRADDFINYDGTLIADASDLGFAADGTLPVKFHVDFDAFVLVGVTRDSGGDVSYWTYRAYSGEIVKVFND